MIKITLTIDQEDEQGVVLIGLIAKALGRGEAGVSGLLIEREGPPVKTAPAPKLSAVARKVATIHKPKRSGYSLGMQAKPGKPNGVIVALQILRDGGSLAELRVAWKAAGLNPDGGIGATLSKLRKRGLVKRVGPGQWQITAEGVFTVNNYEGKANAEVERHDSAVD